MPKTFKRLCLHSNYPQIQNGFCEIFFGWPVAPNQMGSIFQQNIPRSPNIGWPWLSNYIAWIVLSNWTRSRSTQIKPEEPAENPTSKALNRPAKNGQTHINPTFPQHIHRFSRPSGSPSWASQSSKLHDTWPWPQPQYHQFSSRGTTQKKRGKNMVFIGKMICKWLFRIFFWLVVGPPLWQILVNWDDYSPYMGK